MTHPSNSRSVVRNYNRLELLGDAIIDLACTLRAFVDESLTPGQLSDWRYVCGSTEALSRVSRGLGLNRFLQHFSSKLAREIERYTTLVDLSPSVWLDNPPKVMADLFESVLGAVFVDSGYDYKILSFCSRLADPVWSTITPDPPLEPTRELRERIENVPLSWDRVGLAVLADGFVLSSMKRQSQNWHRVVSWKSCQMLKVKPEILVALKNKRQQQDEDGVVKMEIEEKGEPVPEPMELGN